MKEYKRLTIKNNGFIDTNCKNCKQCKKIGRKYICNDMTACDEEIINRLAELEDKIENGTLIDLPCAIGSTIYLLVTKRPKWNFPQFTFIKESKLTFYNLERAITEIGKTVFLTKAEAEAKLKELQSND